MLQKRINYFLICFLSGFNSKKGFGYEYNNTNLSFGNKKIFIRACFKTFQPEVYAYLFKVKSKIPDFERGRAKILTTVILNISRIEI